MFQTETTGDGSSVGKRELRGFRSSCLLNKLMDKGFRHLSLSRFVGRVVYRPFVQSELGNYILESSGVG